MERRSGAIVETVAAISRPNVVVFIKSGQLPVALGKSTFLAWLVHFHGLVSSLTTGPTLIIIR